VANTGFSRSRLANVDLLPDENVRPSGLMEANGKAWWIPVRDRLLPYLRRQRMVGKGDDEQSAPRSSGNWRLSYPILGNLRREG
jgi:hypothetical protein